MGIYVTEGIFLAEGKKPDWNAARAAIATSPSDDCSWSWFAGWYDHLDENEMRAELERIVSTVEEAIRDDWWTMGSYDIGHGKFYFFGGFSSGGEPDGDEDGLFRCFEILNASGLADIAGFGA